VRADVVIVGAGAAGSAIATRASENGDLDVLLLEAGPDYPHEVPEDLRDGTRNSVHDHDWGYWHEPTRGQTPFVFPRGRVVGGSTAVNTCIALRGRPYDHDEWGLDEWTWEKCLPAYRALETDLDFGDAPHHGSDGPIPIRRHTPEELTPWQSAFLEAAASLGFEPCADHNDPEATGYGPHAMNKIDGVRMSAARCYLTPEVRRRENLRIVSGAHAVRVRFEGRRAVGVEVERDGGREVIDAELVIVCGGAIGTPGILLRSGVGPREDLRRLRVDEVAIVESVGARLLDHPGAAIILQPKPGLCRTSDPLIQTAIRFASEGGRPNDLQLQAGSYLPLPIGDFEMVSLMASVGKPRGHGRIVFESADPYAKPRIWSDLLVDPDDRELMCEAMEVCWLLATSPAMRDLARFLAPGERALSSRRAMREWVTTQTGSGYHPCGTVPLGEATDPQGRVKGTEGLVVADASLFPTVPSSNTNLPTLMLGERFGAWLRDGVFA